MKYSYTHNNQRFSVVVLDNGHVMEIRRGDMTFCSGDKRNYWASLAAWKATWPADAVETNTSSQPARHPIIQRLFRGKPGNVYIVPSAETLATIKRQIAYCKRHIDKYRNSKTTNIVYWQRIQESCEKRLGIYKGQHELTPTFRHTRTYVSHHGRMMPVYHNSRENVVFVRDYDPQTKKEVHYTPEELGITENSAFYRRVNGRDVFVPVGST